MNTYSLDNVGIVLGTHNDEKASELSLLLQGLPLNLVSAKDLNEVASLEEIGTTHYENACHKARYWSSVSGGLAIASDGGLVIPSMFGIWNSLYTNRTFIDLPVEQRSAALIELVDRHQPLNRSAFWIEAVAVAVGGISLAAWVARSTVGYIALWVNDRNPRPQFWVNGAWYFPQLGKYYGFLSERERAWYPDHWAVLGPQINSFFQNYLVKRFD